MLTKIRCCKKCNDQYVDLDDISYIEVSDTDYCGGMRGYESKYASVILGMKNGHSLLLTMERTKLDELTTRKSQV
ncbi:hypothetical protein [Acinetobacter sp. ANC 4973]|uniref:hypothetical protein n=1 Tax=Acinetobacter sp. ANC 4973 TaxID=1977871 RepID=UPI000A35887C|nr:hypothetical protein [Acinetobacter sp. ANC 4973]OTG99500.1 hypothetical protein B9T30_08380 [Acinetobacter sp. ANC 4973]